VVGGNECVGAEVGDGGVAVDGHARVGPGEEGSEDVDDAVFAAENEVVGVGAADAEQRWRRAALSQARA